MDLLNVLALGGGNIKVEVTVADLAEFGKAIAQKAVDDLKSMLTESAERAKAMDDEPFWTSAQVCKKLGIGKTTLFSLHHQGKLTPHKVGGHNRYDPQQVRQLLGQIIAEVPADERAKAHPDILN